MNTWVTVRFMLRRIAHCSSCTNGGC